MDPFEIVEIELEKLRLKALGGEPLNSFEIKNFDILMKWHMLNHNKPTEIIQTKTAGMSEDEFKAWIGVDETWKQDNIVDLKVVPKNEIDD